VPARPSPSRRRRSIRYLAAAPEIDADALAAARDAGGVAVVDLARSIEFRAGHIPGAVWAVRSRLAAVPAAVGRARRVVLASPDGTLARLAVDEARSLGWPEVAVLAGGTQAWSASGRAVLADRTDPPDAACVDFYLRPYDRNSGVEAAMRAYLDWEIDLPAAIVRDGTAQFGVPDA
jgi:rhodanese-related sulfurtransferase